MHSVRGDLAQEILEALVKRGYRREALPPSPTLEEIQKALDPKAFAEVLAEVTGYPYIDPEENPPDPSLAQKLPKSLLKQGLILPHHVEGDSLVVVVAVDPFNQSLLNNARSYLRRPIAVAVGPSSSVRRVALRLLEGSMVEPLLQGADEEVPQRTAPQTPSTSLEADELSGARFTLNRIVDEAIHQRATDIHFELISKTKGRVRFRIDGALTEREEFDLPLFNALINVIKVESNLDITQKLLPQDGRYYFVSADGKVRNEIRVSVIPTVLGEEAVLRILPKEGQAPRLANLGFAKSIRTKLEEVANIANGLFLVTGPTGSGKTTTLFAVLQEIKERRNPKILSVEDPVEYRLPGISQVQVNVAAGLTFARALRAFLRQDPDVILVGEIRDQESAKIATEAAMTGHLVLGTLHTNSAAMVPVRLEEMGVEPFKIADALRGALAQRLVPKLCTCKVEDPETAELLAHRYRRKREAIKVYAKGPGCDFCGGTGYVGRVAIHELLWVDGEVRRLIIERASAEAIEEAVRPKGFRTLMEDGLEKVFQGLISYQDLMYSAAIQGWEVEAKEEGE